MSYLSALRESLNNKLEQLEIELSINSEIDPPHLLEAKPYVPLDDAENLLSQQVFDLIEKIRMDLKAVDTLITPTRFKLVEQGTLHYKSAALNVAVNLRIADAIESLGGEADLEDLARKVNVNQHKLGRIMRMLTGEFIFQEISHGVFKNTRHSIALAGSKGAFSFLSFITSLGMKAASGISDDLKNPETKNSFAESTAPFCKAVSKTGQTFFQYMSDPENAAMVELSNEGVVGWLNRLTRASLLNDYPWKELGNATIIDLGAGTGDSGMDIMKKFPDQFRWIYQDLEPVIEILKKTYPEDLKEMVKCGRISFIAQDYFQPNTSDGNIWYMRGVLHEHDDNQAIEILEHVTTAMTRTPNSKLVINEVLNSSPAIIPKSSNLPPSDHIPKSQSALANTANIMTWSTFSLFGGKERSYQEYEQLLNTAGLKIVRVFQFRTFTVMIEAIMNDQNL